MKDLEARPLHLGIDVKASTFGSSTVFKILVRLHKLLFVTHWVPSKFF